MAQDRLIGFHGVVFSTVDRIDVGPIHLELSSISKVLLRCETDSIYNAFLELLSGRILPREGRLDEANPVRIQTDRNLRDALHPNRTVRELLESAHLPDTIWLGQRRRSLFGVIDKLELSTRNFHLPLKMEPAGVAGKFWALRFIASTAQLIIGREIFMLDDPAIRKTMALRWGDFPGAVIYAGPPELLPGAVDVEILLGANGGVQVRQLRDPISPAQKPAAADEAAGAPERPDSRGGN